MRMFLFPDYVSLGSAEANGPRLFDFLRRRKVRLTKVKWNGRVESLPTRGRVIVRVSSQISQGTWNKVAAFCAKHGHLCFYDNSYINADGSKTANLPLKAAKFLQPKNKKKAKKK